jgi:hypothetical protein
LGHSDRVRQMPEDERTTAQIRLVYDLLVKTHPDYHNFRDEGEWAFAQKRADRPSSRDRTVVKEVVVVEKRVGLGGALMEMGRRLRRP